MPLILINKMLPLLFIIGVFIPTSINGQITNQFSLIGCFILFITMIVLLFRHKRISISSLNLLLVTNFLLLFYTLISPFSEYRFGTFILFLVLTIIFCLDFNQFEIDLKIFRRSFQVVNIGFIILSLGIIYQYIPVLDFITKWYSAFYDVLVPNMIYQQKPVITFGTHSIAGFYCFIFFLINIITYYYLKLKRHFLISIIYMVFLYFLQSSTSLVYFLICFIIILVLLFHKNKPIFFATLTMFIIFLLINYQDITIFQQTNERLFSDNNGLLARYSKEGNLNNNIEYILNHPFRGVGFSYSNQLLFVDSGIVEYTLRGSFLTLISILLSFFLFLKRNLKKSLAIVFFLIFLSFEVGFSNLIYFRTLFIIPFIVAYLHGLTTVSKKKTELTK